MDAPEILARFDAEMRAQPPAEEGVRVERVPPVVRIVGDHCTVLYSQLDSANAREIVAREAAYFRSLGREVEWKVYGHDRPSHLGDLLREAGFVPDPPESLMVRDLSIPFPESSVPPGLEVRRVVDEDGLRTAVAVSEDAFGPSGGWHLAEYVKRLEDPALTVWLASVKGVPVASARLEMPAGRSFAGLWGGGTIPEYRGRGIYQRLVFHRAGLARSRGYRFLTVEALETSRPILARLGFERLDTTTGWVGKP